MDAPDAVRIEVSVAYARPERQWVLALQVAEATPLAEVVRLSGLLQECPELQAPGGSGLDLARYRLGVFGQLRDAQTAVRAGERVEIYRPLVADPKDARREAAARARRGR